MYADA